MLTGIVVTAPLSEKTFHAGATGYDGLTPVGARERFCAGYLRRSCWRESPLVALPLLRC